MSVLRYITHPNVMIDRNVPVPKWGLNEVGVQRTERMLGQPWVSSIGRIISSDETKALEAATILSTHLNVPVEVRAESGENDRSGTGFVPPEKFEKLADAFFAKPEVSVRGWERAVDAQARIVSALSDLLDYTTGSKSVAASDIAIVGHGGVGTLWYCHLTDRPIDRRHDQSGQGQYFSLDLETGNVIHPWRPIEH